MTLSTWIAAIALPMIGGLHRYCASYGYRGVSRYKAWTEAWRVGLCLTLISCIFVAVEVIS